MSTIWLPPTLREGPLYGTQEWYDARRGLVTASRFGDVMSDPRSKAAREAGLFGDAAMSYYHELVAARITGQDKVGGRSAAMDRGVDLEADAIDAYARSRFVDVEKGRLVIMDGGRIGASTDGFIEEDPDGPGCIEVKCPEAKTHIKTFMSGEGTKDSPRLVPDEYVEQVQGQLWVLQRRWCDFVSYDNRFPLPMQLIVIRVYRDEDAIAAIAGRVVRFAEMVARSATWIQDHLARCGHDQSEFFHNALEEAANNTTLQSEG